MKSKNEFISKSQTNGENTCYEIPLSGIVRKKELFYDREKEIQRIIHSLKNGADIAIVGEAGVGKSSILWRIYERAEYDLPEWKVIYLDLEAITDEKDFVKKLSAELGINVQLSYEKIKECIEKRVKRKSLSKECRGNKKEENDEGIDEKRNIVLILDEFDKVRKDKNNEKQDNDMFFGENFTGWLRYLAQGEEFDLVIALREKPLTAFPDTGLTSPFYNIFKVIKIEPFDKETVRNYIIKIGQKYAVNPNESAKIFKLTKGHPRMVNLALYANCMWKSFLDEKTKKKYKKWENYFKTLGKIYEPYPTSLTEQILGSKRIKVALGVIGFFVTAVLIDEQLYSFVMRITHAHPPLHWALFGLYLFFLWLTSLSAAFLLVSLGLEGVVKLIAMMK